MRRTWAGLRPFAQLQLQAQPVGTERLGAGIRGLPFSVNGGIGEQGWPFAGRVVSSPATIIRTAAAACEIVWREPCPSTLNRTSGASGPSGDRLQPVSCRMEARTLRERNRPALLAVEAGAGG